MEKFDPTKLVQTRSGKRARILCTNLINDDFPIVAAITINSAFKTFENVYFFTKDGNIIKDGTPHPYDLINI